MADVPLDTDVQDPEFRFFADKLRQIYPGAKLSEILAQGAKMEQMLLDDPVAAYEALVSSYTRAAPSPGYVEPRHQRGLKGSLARARQDQEDAEDLKDWIAKYGKRLPKIMAQLELYDRSLRANPSVAAATLAVRIGGAPAIELEVPAFLAAREQKAVQQKFDGIHGMLCEAIEKGALPGIKSRADEADALPEIIAILQLPNFHHHPTDTFNTLWRAASLAVHPEWKRISPRKGGGKSNGAADKSISGAPNAGQGGRESNREKGSGGVRDFDRARQSGDVMSNVVEFRGKVMSKHFKTPEDAEMEAPAERSPETWHQQKAQTGAARRGVEASSRP